MFAAVIFLGAVGVTAIRRGEPAAPASPSPSEVTTTGLLMKGTLRCTVSIADPVLPGAILPITFTMENVSSTQQEVETPPWNYTYVIEGADGSIFDTQALSPFSVPYVEPKTLTPGESYSPTDVGRPVQSPGPLKITPRCGQRELDPVTVDVVADGPAPSREAAIGSVAGSTAGLLEDCMPAGEGTPTVGTIQPPPGSDLQPMSATCSATVDAYEGFDVVTLRVVAPADAGPIRVAPGIPVSGSVTLPPDPTVEAIVWRFVVTSQRVIGVSGIETDRTEPADVMAPRWGVSHSGWKAGGTSRCGGTGISTGGTATVEIVFVNVCPGFAPSG